MVKVPVIAIFFLTLLLVMPAYAADNPSMLWDMKALSVAPKYVEDVSRSSGDVKAIFYDGLPWKGKPTKVFAYYGIPKAPAGQKVPAMVLVHGGGGSAYIPWVQLWMDRGYAAISMDTCGCISHGGNKNHPRHPDGGPPGWGDFNNMDEPIEDQWTYHAVADAILAHSLIRSFPEVDAGKTGLTGISWGGYLTCIIAGVDDRFKFAAPVYGCGFLRDNSSWAKGIARMDPEKAQKWQSLWDPSVYLPHVKMPMLWITGTNDGHYPMDSLQKSYRLPQTPRTLCIRVRMIHGHGGPGENPEEIHALANALFNQGTPLAHITGSGQEKGNAWVTFKNAAPIVRAEFTYTKQNGEWKERLWETSEAQLDANTGKATATIPEGVKVWYFNLFDNRDCAVSSEHVVVD